MTDLILSFIISLLIAIATGFFIIPLLRTLKLGQQIRDDGPKKHLEKAGTPSMGGIIFLLPVLVVSLIFKFNEYSLFMLAVTLGFALLGFLDDFIKVIKKRSLGLRAYQKIIGQVGISLIIALYAYYNPHIGTELEFFGTKIDFGIWYIPFTIFTTVAMVNAVNLTDGVDGLAGSCSLLNFATFAVLCFALSLPINGTHLLDPNIYDSSSIFSIAFAGAVLGFLMFNSHPAKVFMGDTGSLALGAAITVLGVVTGLQFILPIIGIMYVLSAVSVIIQVGYFKLTHGKRVFKMAPLHHHFELSGFSEKKVVFMYSFITALACMIAVIMINII